MQFSFITVKPQPQADRAMGYGSDVELYSVKGVVLGEEGIGVGETTGEAESEAKRGC